MNSHSNNNDIQSKTKVYNLVILDKSGSMDCIQKEAIDGFNETLASIRVAQDKHIDTQEHNYHNWFDLRNHLLNLFHHL